MKAGRVRMILGRLREAAQPMGGLSDGQLLGRFIARRDDGAFQALVRRHGPMVLAVCRRVLRHAQDAEDAFQATFLVLARKAAAVADREAVAGWLHGVAYRAALGARAAALRRKAKERQVDDMPHPVAPPEDDQRELLELLDRELARLPEKYRLPVVLCELEGRSRREAARQLGLPEGTLSSRLATARKRLAARLSRGGAAVSAAAVASLFARGARAASVPARLLITTGRVAGGTVPAIVATLTEGVMKSMLLTKLKATAWGLLLAASLSVGAVALTYRPAAAQPGPEAGGTPAVALPTAPLPPGAAPAALPPAPDLPTPAFTPPLAATPPAGPYVSTPSDPMPRLPATPPAVKPPDRDELEALRLEVEELRQDLKATKERVKALENQVRGPAGVGAANPFGAGVGNNTMGRTTGSGTIGAIDFGPGPMREGDTAGDVGAAMEKLRHHPDDKQALEVLDHAILRLRAESKQKWNEASELEEFEQAVQRLQEPAGPTPPKPLAPPAQN